VTKKWLLYHFLSGLTPTSYASSAFQADFAANCKIWDKSAKLKAKVNI
jgi:hypothetical protein